MRIVHAARVDVEQTQLVAQQLAPTGRASGIVAVASAGATSPGNVGARAPETAFARSPRRPDRVVALLPLPGETNCRTSRGRVRCACAPSAVAGPVEEARRLLAALLRPHTGDSPVDIDPEVACRATGGLRSSTFDHTIARDADFGHGLMVDVGQRATSGRHTSSFGPVSRFRCSAVFALTADPRWQSAAAPGAFTRWIRFGSTLVADVDTFSILDDAAISRAPQAGAQ